MFKRKYTVPEYGYEVELYEPTIGESMKLEEAYNKADWPEIYKAFSPLIAKWNCTDRNDVLLPTTPEGLSQLPLTILRFLVKSLSESMSKGLDSKNISTS